MALPQQTCQCISQRTVKACVRPNGAAIALISREKKSQKSLLECSLACPWVLGRKCEGSVYGPLLKRFLSPGMLGKQWGCHLEASETFQHIPWDSSALAITCSPHYLPIKDSPFLNKVATLQSISPSTSLIQGVHILP